MSGEPVGALKQAGRLLRAGQAPSVPALLRHALARGDIGTSELHAAGRMLKKLFEPASAAADALPTPLRVLILGQCTTSWLATTLTAVCWRHGVAADVGEGPYDNVMQALDALDPSAAPDALVLLPWHDRLLRAGGLARGERAAQELAFWSRAMALAREKGIKRVILVGLDWVGPGAAGFGLSHTADAAISLVHEVNAGLRASLPEAAYFVPLPEVSGHLGRRHFYEARRQHWTRQPFSEAGLEWLAEHLFAGLRALTTGPRKVLVLDLDNTLWGGVVGEAGPLGVALGDSPEGEAFRSFQREVLALAERGVVLAVCSKNNREDAEAPFRQHPDMVLGLEHIACFVASWQSKDEGLRAIAAQLRLGLDSFVFFDDNPAERELIRQALPEVEVAEVPADPADYVQALQCGLWFETTALTADDAQRTQRYAAQRLAEEARGASTDLDAYLRSLAMRAELRRIDEADMQRVVQLLGKTNQFNLTTRRHTADDVRRLLAPAGSIGLTLRLADRFADHGLVALAIATPQAGVDGAARVLRIDSLLMSCRVIGRGVERFLMAEVLREAAALGYERVLGEYLPTAKNQQVAGFYAEVGFAQAGGADGGVLHYGMHAPLRVDATPFIERVPDDEAGGPLG